MLIHRVSQFFQLFFLSLFHTHTDIHRSKIVFLFVYYPFCISGAVCFLFCDFLVNEDDKHVVYKYHIVSYVNLL